MLRTTARTLPARWWSTWDATLVTAHSDKEGAAPTFKRGFGHHPPWAFLDHGPDGTGEPLAFLLRPGNAADHITVARDALRQLPSHRPGTRPGRRALVRTDAAGATHTFLDGLCSQRLSYLVGFTLPGGFEHTLRQIPKRAWSPAYDADGEIRENAQLAEAIGLLDLSGWPPGMRVIIRPERPHPGRSCGSPTSTATGSPRSPPTPAPAGPVPSSPTSSCGTADGPAPRTEPLGQPARRRDQHPAHPGDRTRLSTTTNRPDHPSTATGHVEPGEPSALGRAVIPRVQNPKSPSRHAHHGPPTKDPGKRLRPHVGAKRTAKGITRPVRVSSEQDPDVSDS
jgi:hypothetical protein